MGVRLGLGFLVGLVVGLGAIGVDEPGPVELLDAGGAVVPGSALPQDVRLHRRVAVTTYGNRRGCRGTTRR